MPCSQCVFLMERSKVFPSCETKTPQVIQSGFKPISSCLFVLHNHRAYPMTKFYCFLDFFKVYCFQYHSKDSNRLFCTMPHCSSDFSSNCSSSFSNSSFSNSFNSQRQQHNPNDQAKGAAAACSCKRVALLEERTPSVPHWDHHRQPLCCHSSLLFR